jgi:hypothetical protein
LSEAQLRRVGRSGTGRRSSAESHRARNQEEESFV